ncbi:MAG: thiamine biosynthesis protein ThiF [Epsilonproteobacteria bacterium]|nr:thiamine biosynthesis protein ThiF [Campylobacterota bacterium]NPA63512.1 HesA/MoeB/ThiF family protein [Campylobacterota bacterium]
MRDYFRRQIELWGEETQKKLQEKSVAIVGCGGLGSSLALALGASGIGRIYLVDFDEVSRHNIHRQITFGMEDEGKSKAKINAQAIQRRCPYVEVESFAESFEEFADRGIRPDLILDATDNLPTRARIDSYAKSVGVPWIYASVEEFQGQVCFMERASFDAFSITDRKPGGIAAPMVMLVASFEANLALRYLAGLSIQKDRLYYLFFDESGDFIVNSFNMPKE